MNFSGVDIPGLDIPGVEDEADEAFDNGATGEIPGVHDPSDNDSDSDSDDDDDEHHPIHTRSGRTVHSTQIKTMCTPPLDLIPLFYNRLENLRLIILGIESSR